MSASIKSEIREYKGFKLEPCKFGLVQISYKGVNGPLVVSIAMAMLFIDEFGESNTIRFCNRRST